jgi:hypothetical protein
MYVCELWLKLIITPNQVRSKRKNGVYRNFIVEPGSTDPYSRAAADCLVRDESRQPVSFNSAGRRFAQRDRKFWAQGL